ncbi:retrovirus-related pol polyprotein from transposon TNT 1-94 [Tanacetum coccineum]
MRSRLPLLNKLNNRSLKQSQLDQVSNASNQKYPTQSSESPQSSNQPSLVDNFQLDSGSTSTDNLIESLTNTLTLFTQSYKSHLPQTNNQLRTSSNARNKATVQDDRVVVQDVRGRYNVNNQGRPFQRNYARGVVGTGNVGGQNKVGNMNLGQAKPIMCYNCKGIGHIARELLDEEQLVFLAGEQVTNFDDDVDDLALNVDHVFETNQCDAFNSDVDEGPTTQTMFMANLTSKEARASYDSNIPSEVQDREYDSDCEDKYHEVHEMQSDVQHKYVVDYDADYTSDSNIIPYDQYVEDNEEHVVQSNVSSVRNDALMSILDEMHEQKGFQKLRILRLIRRQMKVCTKVLAKSKVLAPRMNAIDVEPIPPRLKNKRSAHLDYINHLKESVETVREIVKEARIVKPLDSALPSAYQELFTTNNTQKTRSATRKFNSTNVHVIHSTGVNTSTEASGSKPRTIQKKKLGSCMLRVEKRRNLNKREKQIWKPKGKLSDNSLNKTKQVWKATGKLFANVGYQWRSTGKKVALGKLNCGYQWRPTGKKFALGELCPLTKLSVKCCSKHMTGNRSKLMNFVEKFIGTVRFGNDHFGAIMGYGDYVIGDSVISRVYYVEGLGHNLFSVGQFCDSDLEVAFRKHTCFVRDINGADILKGSRSTNLYTISIDEMMKSSPICLLSKASKSKSWLWHRRLNHLNFGTINDLARKDLVRGLPRLKFEKDHLCSACQLGKSKKFSHKPKSENTNMEVLHILLMDLFTWVKFLRSKDETPEFVINFLKQIQVGLNKTVIFIRTDIGTEFVNQVMSEYYEGVGIFHQKSIPRTPQQNSVVERCNHTLVEVARTMMIFSKAPMFLWAEAVATASLCYPINDSEDLGKFQAKADIRIFVGYAGARVISKLIATT